MNVLLFGATGMVGRGVLQESLLDPDVRLVQSVERSTASVQHAKPREIIHPDLWDYTAIEAALSGFDACFFCLGVSSCGMKEDGYERVMYRITLAASTLARLNPRMTFVYVAGAGTDSTEKEEACGRASKVERRTRCCSCRSKQHRCSARASSSRCMAYVPRQPLTVFSTPLANRCYRRSVGPSLVQP